MLILLISLIIPFLALALVWGLYLHQLRLFRGEARALYPDYKEDGMYVILITILILLIYVCGYVAAYMDH